MVVSGDASGVVDPVDLLLAEEGVVPDKVPQLRPAHEVGPHGEAPAGLLAAVVHHAPAHQFHDAAADHLRLHAQVPLARIGQALPHRVGKAPQAELDAGPVRHQVRDEAGDAAVQLVRRGRAALQRRRAAAQDTVRLRHMEAGVPLPGAGDGRQPVVDLHQQKLAFVNGLPGHGGRPEGAAHPPVLIRRCAGHHRHPGRPVHQPPGRAAEVDGVEGHVPLLRQGPLGVEKAGVGLHVGGKRRREQGRVRRRHHKAERHVSPLRPQAAAQGIVKGPGPAGMTGQGHRVAVADQGRCVLRRHFQGPVLGAPAVQPGAPAPARGSQVHGRSPHLLDLAARPEKPGRRIHLHCTPRGTGAQGLRRGKFPHFFQLRWP